ncbi:MAG: class I SAM-dependent methyltransferase [Halioglobus sp.]
MTGVPTLSSWVDNSLVLGDNGIFVEEGHESIAYTDGKDVERYLHRAFTSCSDLSSTSAELESWIKDWPSEYHLSRGRAQLLNGLSYDSSATVMEVGCGCGAITRFLGETFDQVISVEGSISRAKLARLRCREQDNVSIISAPFQNIRFKKKFDIIFCIGVFEYSQFFVDGEDPYSAIIRYFSDHLTEDGVLVLAIENQFGLKYFASASEDHSGRRYDGIEGYYRGNGTARTFGKDELRAIVQKDFPQVDFCFPFPDYKIVNGLVDEQALEKIDTGELIGHFTSRDYSKPYRPNFSERRAWLEIARNNQVAFFANSFLALARKKSCEDATDSDRRLASFDHLALAYNRSRAEAFHTRTSIQLDYNSGDIRVTKEPLNQPTEGSITLRGYEEAWCEGESLHAQMLTRAFAKDASVNSIFSICKPWLAHLHTNANEAGSLPNNWVDAIWQNTFTDGGTVYFIDQEWESRSAPGVKLLLIRACYQFLVDLRSYGAMPRALNKQTTSAIITQVGRLLGENISEGDLSQFLEFEADLRSTARGETRSNSHRHIKRILALNQRTIALMFNAGEALNFVNFYLRKALRIANRLIQNRLQAPD